jgi:hypothetical protein
VDGSTTTRGDLLQMRTQKKADKYCWEDARDTTS